MTNIRNIIFLLLLSLIGCTSIEGTRDKSFTFNRQPLSRKCEAIAVFPIKEIAAFPGLSERIEVALCQNLQDRLGSSNVIPPKSIGEKLANHDLIGKFGQWRVGYEESKFLDGRPLREFADTIGADFFLLVNSVDLSREKIRGIDTGYHGWVSDANNVWRTDLKFSGEMIDAKSGEVVWRGFGHAENINSPKRDLDLFFIVHHQKNPEIAEFIDEMIRVASNGFINHLANP